MRARVAVLVGGKGRGSNMANLVRAGREGLMPAEVVLVLSPAEGTPAVDAAFELGVPVRILPKEDVSTFILENLYKFEVEWLCLAGYLQLLPPEVVHALSGRLLNIHPALLPKFGGKGMYGVHVHKAVLAAGETESGCTVHLVTEVYDEGEVVLQKRCPVLAADTPETLAARVLALEHEAYPEALALLVERAARVP
ncbi:MAG: phosphoribosylglycinamide formyltransferase [Fimbriimonadaceae bacterium]|nr:phosphoribosylglycinamide formyltransferase [Fimbriimonadaceae bacterium]QYK56406.1 MAG: phosphoribosylglycinamide formyltransferase [Fimbriimonadaceae bacterium]